MQGETGTVFPLPTIFKNYRYTRYTIDGKELGEPDYLHNIGLIATNVAISLASDDAVARKSIEKFWNTPLRRDKRCYYDNCLYFFSLLALSGNYRIC